MPATLSDVAREAGVSEATASRVMNGRRYVAATTRARVQSAVAQLDYVPNRAARDLSTARTATVALLVHHAQYPAHGEGTFTSRIVEGVAHRLRARGYDLLYAPVNDESVIGLGSLSAVRAGRTDGVLLLGPAFPPASLAGLLASRRPMVLIDNRHAGVDAVLADNHAAATAMATHLLRDHNYRRLGFVGGPAGWPSTAERLAGVVDAATREGATVRVIHAAETTMRDGAEAASSLLADLPEAIVAVNDAMAIGVMHRLRSVAAERRPAVVGFDDIAWAQLTDPPLTTVAIDATAMGALAAERLLERLASGNSHDDETREVRLPTTVRLRQSCGCRGESVAPAG